MLPYIALLAVYFVAGIPAAYGLECYSCTNVTMLKDCQLVTSCAPGMKCFMDARKDGVVKHFTLGCAALSHCPSPSPANVTSIMVGRSVSTNDNCMDCCNTSNCNRQLCQSYDSSCEDDKNCESMGSMVNLCLDTRHAKQYCQRFCGLCSIIDGGWSAWSTWSTCDVTCGNGTHTKTRTCTNPTPVDGGDDCVGERHETETCHKTVCPVHGAWSLWSPWGGCSSTCDIGMQRRDRSCSRPYPDHNGHHCFGESRDDRLCFPGACADGDWSNWGSWSACTVSCGYGTQKRSRACDNPAPSLTGKVCTGDNLQTEICHTRACHDGQWSSWSAWSACSKTCGDGLRSRARDCNNPAPSLTGQYCVGTSQDTEMCSVRRCAAQWSAFTATNVVKNTNTWETLVFPVTKINEGQHYNPTTGVFTCQIPGLYYFTVDLTKKRDYNSRVDEISGYIRKNGKTIAQVFIDPYPADADKGSFSATGSVVTHLVMGDTVSVYEYYRLEPWSSFSGFLINPDP